MKETETSSSEDHLWREPEGAEASSGERGRTLLDAEMQAREEEELLIEIQRVVHTSVHQLRSPLSAMRTLSKLLLRRLGKEGQDGTNRELVRDILIQSDRIGELLSLLDSLARRPASYQPSAEEPSSWALA